MYSHRFKDVPAGQGPGIEYAGVVFDATKLRFCVDPFE